MARPHPALIDIAAGREANPPIDETEFVRSAGEHRLAGLAFWAAEAGFIELGTAARRDLAGAKLATAAHNRKVAGAAASVMSEIEDAGHHVAIFKGVATESRWYPEPGTRPSADADLLLRPGAGDLDTLIGRLVPDHPLQGRISGLVERGHIQSIDFQWNDIWIDLHFDPFKVGIPLAGLGRLWDHMGDVELDGEVFRALGAEASLLQAAIHLQKDRFSRLYGFADVAFIAGSPGLDWEMARALADDLGLAVHFNETLAVVGEVLRLSIPYDAGLRSAVWRAIWPERSRLRGSVGMTRRVRTHYWIPFTMRGRRLDALRFWYRKVVPPGDIVDYMHPNTSGPYPLRVIQYRSRLVKERHARNRDQRRAGQI